MRPGYTIVENTYIRLKDPFKDFGIFKTGKELESIWMQLRRNSERIEMDLTGKIIGNNRRIN